MKYKTVGSVKTYQVLYLSQFHYNKIALEDTFPQDKPDEECIMELDARIEKMARVQYPELFQQDKSFVSALAASLRNSGNPYPEPDTRTVLTLTPKTDTTNSEPEEQKPLLQLIQESKTVKELKAWRLLIQVQKNKEELQEAYDKKMVSLTLKETV